MMGNPFTAGVYEGRQTYHTTAYDRIHAAQSFDRDQCAEALACTGLQKTVIAAVQRRQRALEREAVVKGWAWCWATGLIEFGDVLPAEDADGGGAIAIGFGPRGALRDFFDVMARHGYDGQLLVPGVPEADGQVAKGDALSAWLAWCGQRPLPNGIQIAGEGEQRLPVPTRRAA